MSEPLISVIVPVYNTEKYLTRCVHSITAQTYRNIELWLVDDGSTDKSGKLCDELALEDVRIHVLHKANGGSSSARNLALEHINGEYVGFIDSDDYIEPYMYERLLEAILRYNVRVAQIGRDEIDEQGNLLPNICEPPREDQVISDVDFMRELLMHRGDCSFCTKLMDAKLMEGRRFPLNKLNEDFYLLVHMLPEIGNIVSLPKQGYHVFYRIGSNSRKESRESFSRVFADSVENSDVVSKIVGEKYPELVSVTLRFSVFQRLEYLLHIPVTQMTNKNLQYVEIKKWMRKNWAASIKNRWLTGKNKIYHTLFAIAPKTVRWVHKKIKRL